MTTGEQLIDYEALTQSAMRSVVKAVLERTASSGLPGDHHFYISFDTCADGVSVSKRLKGKYATEMTIVLQHRFWDLNVYDDYFEVKLTFDGIPERLVVPYNAIKVFFDPSVRYGLQFDEQEFNSDAIDRTITPLEMSEFMKSTRENAHVGQTSHQDDRPTISPRLGPREISAATEDESESGNGHGQDDDRDHDDQSAKTDLPKKLKKPSRVDDAATVDATEANPDGENATDEDTQDDAPAGAEIVSLDAFRKK